LPAVCDGMAMTTVLDQVISIRRVRDIDEYRQCERLQERIWGPRGVARVPLLDLLTAQDNGGLVLGAFEGGELVGFAFSFLGMDPRYGLKHCSVVLAVAEEHRGRGLAVKLKRAQRDEVLAQGIDLITWTFDPLLAVNARLNIHRLGAISHTYRVNHYGDAGGLETDRLIVEWWLRRDRGATSLGTTGQPDAGAVPAARVVRVGGLPQIAAVVGDFSAGTLLLPIPADMRIIQRCDRGLARAWREQTRALFQDCFARGYAVVGFEPTVSLNGTVAYLLRRDAP